ncbi:MAG: efflux transporter outer membrane subunit [Parvularculaceae bacterium]
MPFFKTLIASASALTIAACATGPDYDAPSAPGFVADAYETDAAATAEAAEPAQRWWTSLGDETLDGLVAAAFAENRDIRQAAANVEAARALLRLERVNLRPEGALGADYQRRRIAGAGFGIDDQVFPDTDFFDVGASASWELDFFGRVRRGGEAAYAEAGGAEALRRDAQVLVAAETVRAYTDYRGADVQLAVARQNLKVQRQTLELTETRLAEGLGSQLDVARAASQAKSTEAAIPPLQAAKNAAANRLATLTGSDVATVERRLADDEATLPAPPDVLAIADPGALIDRRPDVRVAERALAAATARIGGAKAEYYPRISLVGAVSASAQSLAGVGDEGALGYGVGPSLSWAGIDVPRIRAQVKAAGAEAEAAFAAYEQSVLLAIEETQTALAAYGREKVRFDALVDAAAKAAEAAELARLRYDDGVDDFIDVLDAEARQLAAEAALAESRTAVTRNFADVHRALGAGWAPERDDDPLSSVRGDAETEQAL